MNKVESVSIPNFTAYFEDGKQIYPCRCGITHIGKYALCDYEHHNCLHETDLIGLPGNKNEIQVICPDCGMSWKVKIEKKEHNE